MNRSWSSEEILKALKVKSASVSSWNAMGISTDSRTIVPGNIFLALSGDRYDGHNYVDEAFNNGASAAIISRKIESIENKNFLLVSDTFDALKDLAIHSRNTTKAKIIAITGSVGKTTTKELLYLSLKNQFKVFKSEGNLNNHIGVPLSMARMPVESDFAIFELGMNKSGEIRNLSNLLKPNYSLITSVEAAHLEFFKSIDSIADAKSEIIEETQKNGVAILNKDSAYFEKLFLKAKRNELKVISFSTKEKSDVKLVNHISHEDYSCVKINIFDQLIAVKIGVPGDHFVQNALSVLALVYSVGGDLSLAGICLADIKPVVGRGNRVELKINDGKAILIDESYNASPASMRLALQTLGKIKKNKHSRKIAVLGDMLELGEESVTFHESLMSDITKSGIDIVFSSGKYMHYLNKILPDNIKKFWSLDISELTNLIISELKPDDIIMLKGSHGSKINLIVNKLEDFYQQKNNLKRVIN